MGAVWLEVIGLSCDCHMIKYIAAYNHVAECEQLKAQNQELKRQLELAEQSQGELDTVS